MKHLLPFPAALAWVITAACCLADDKPRVLGDREFYTRGNFIAWAGPWSTDFGPGKEMKHGVDFADEIAFDPGTFPSKVEFSWHWPLKAPAHTGVYGYNAVSFGSYDGGLPEQAVTPRQIEAITALTETFRFTMARPIGEFNVLSELFLTTEPAGTKVGEVGFFLHASESAMTFAEAGEQLGDYLDAAGRSWKVAKQPAPHGPFYLFIPNGDVLEGTVDFKAALEFLRGKGHITGKEWFNGLAFGVEPVTGSGSMRLEKWELTYE